jgi:multidrug resistance efflux pump
VLNQPEPVTLGFPRQELPPRMPAAPRATPQPHRPKGRWFVTILLLAACSLGAHNVWHSFYRYQAYGTVAGRVIEVSSVWDGSLRYVHVKEGDVVRQGQLVAVMDNVELRQKHARITDELRVAQAQLEAETARLKWQSAFGLDQSQGSTVLYRELLGTLLREEANLANARQKLRRAEQTYQRRALAQEELFQYRYEVQGLDQRIARIKEGLEELKKRSEQAGKLMKSDSDLGKGLKEAGTDQLKPFLAKITALQAERDRLQELLDAGELRAPTNGVVTKLRRFPGEQCKTGEAVLTVLQEGSLEVVLYVQQGASKDHKLGDELNLQVEPNDSALTCVVSRLGDQMEPAPESIKRHYAEGQRLLPVLLKPKDESSSWAALRVGSTVKLPRY